MSKERITLDITATNEEEALAQAQFELGVSADALRAEVLDQPDSESGRAGRFRVSLVSVDDGPPTDINPDDIEQLSRQVLADILEHMHIEAEIDAEWRDAEAEDEGPLLMLSIQGDHIDALIGHRGETIASLQYLARMIVARKLKSPANFVIDVAGYKARRAQQLEFLAQRIADQVIESGRAMHLEPMPAHERRVIHVTLRNHPEVTTKSVGEGSQRRVTILPV